MLTSTAGQEESQTQAAMSNYHCIQLLLPAILTLTTLRFSNSCFFGNFFDSSGAVLSLPCHIHMLYSGVGVEGRKTQPNLKTQQLCAIFFFFVLFLLFFFFFTYEVDLCLAMTALEPWILRFTTGGGKTGAPLPIVPRHCRARRGVSVCGSRHHDRGCQQERRGMGTSARWERGRPHAGCGVLGTAPVRTPAACQSPCSSNISGNAVPLDRCPTGCPPGPAGTCLCRGLRCPAAQPSPGFVFPLVFPQPSRAGAEWAQGGLSRVRHRPGTSSGRVLDRGSPPCSPATASHPCPTTGPTSLDLIDEVTPKLCRSNISQSYSLTTPQ